jgi:GSH-dependent disulfide-bond oxidoreductase
MADSPAYTPPTIWSWTKETGGRFASINRPIAGATHDKDLPVGRHPLQLYSLATPNGVKVTLQHRLPSMWEWPEQVQEGLMS